MKASILRYWLAMNASALDAAVHSSVAFFGVAGAHAVSDSIPALNLQQFAAVFLIAFGRAILSYLDAHPLSALVGGEVKSPPSLVTSAPTMAVAPGLVTPAPAPAPNFALPTPNSALK